MKVLLILARTLGFIVVFFFLVLVVNQIIMSIQQANQSVGINFKEILFYILVFFASFSYFLAWRHEGLGGLFMTLSAIAISSLSDWELGFPFFIVGQIFVLFWILVKMKSPLTHTVIIGE